MIVSLGYRKNGFDAFGGEILRKENMVHWDEELRCDPRGVALGLSEEIRNRMYPQDVDGAHPMANRDAHTAYIGQIVDAYILRAGDGAGEQNA